MHTPPREPRIVELVLGPVEMVRRRLAVDVARGETARRLGDLDERGAKRHASLVGLA